MGLACSKRAYETSSSIPEAKYNFLPQIHTGALLDSWCLGEDRIITCGSDGLVVEYNASSMSARRLGRHYSSVNRIAGARSSSHAVIYSCSRDLTVAQWSLECEAQLDHPMNVFRGHELNVTAVAVSDDGETVCSGSRDCSLRMWDANTALETGLVRIPRNVVTCACWLPGTRAFAQGSEDLRLRVWDTRHLCKSAVQVFGEYTFFPLATNASNNGNLLATASKGFNNQGGEVRVWDRRRPGKQALCEMFGHQQDVTGVIFLDEQQKVVSASKDSNIKVWDLNTFKLDRNIQAADGDMYTSLSMAPAVNVNTMIAGTSFQGGLYCFDNSMGLLASVPSVS